MSRRASLGSARPLRRQRTRDERPAEEQPTELVRLAAGAEAGRGCEERKDGERDALLEAVAYLDGKMGEIKNAGKVSGTDRIAVMAALNIAHEFLSTKLGNGFDIGQAKRRIELIEAKLDEAIARQDKLF